MDVSVIVPCYGVARFLPRFVTCLKAQSFRGTWEALFVDDGDPEGDYAAVDDPRMRVLHIAHGGVSAARNAGLDAARGAIVLFADPDDLFSPTWMETLVAGMGTGSDAVDLAWGGFTHETVSTGANGVSLPPDVGMTYADGAVRSRVWRAVFGYRLRDLWRVMTSGGLWRGCRRELAMLFCRGFRRDAIGDLRFDPGLTVNEDAIFLAAYACRARSMRVIGETGYRYEIRPDGAEARSHAPEAYVRTRFALRDARMRLDPRKTHWRGTFWVNAFSCARLGGIRTGLRYVSGAALAASCQSACDARVVRA